MTRFKGIHVVVINKKILTAPQPFYFSEISKRGSELLLIMIRIRLVLFNGRL